MIDRVPEESSPDNEQKQGQQPAIPRYPGQVGQEHKNRTDPSRDKSPHWADRTVAVFTVLIFLTYLTSNYFACQTLSEIKRGGADTHELAVAAKSQADAAKAIAEAAKAQAESGAAQAGSMKDVAERTFAQAKATNALAAESKRSADIAESQIASPWVGIEQGTFRMSEPRFVWKRPEAPDVIVLAQFSVRNYGTLPGLRYSEHFEAATIQSLPFLFGWFRPGVPDVTDGSHFVAHCPPQMVARTPPRGDELAKTILPGERQTTRAVEVTARSSPDPKVIGGIYVAVCLMYYDQRGTLHTSAYSFVTLPERPTEPALEMPGHPGWAYSRFAPAVLNDSRAK